MFEYPQIWVWSQVPLEGPPLHPPPPPHPRTPPPPPHQTGPPRPGALQKESKGVGGRGRERAGREGLWLEGRALQLQWGMGGGCSVGARPTSGGCQYVSVCVCVSVVCRGYGLRWRVCRANFARTIFFELRISLWKMLRNFPRICSAFILWVRKIPQISRQISLRKIQRNSPTSFCGGAGRNMGHSNPPRRTAQTCPPPVNRNMLAQNPKSLKP